MLSVMNIMVLPKRLSKGRPVSIISVKDGQVRELGF